MRTGRHYEQQAQRPRNERGKNNTSTTEAKAMSSLPKGWHMMREGSSLTLRVDLCTCVRDKDGPREAEKATQ